MNIVKTIGLPATLEQLAEECAELAHASLKMARILRKENPTPADIEKVKENLLEEAMDVKVCLTVLDNDSEIETYDSDMFENKYKRWESRLKPKKWIRNEFVNEFIPGTIEVSYECPVCGHETSIMRSQCPACNTELEK